jgi:hypothetical protein
LTITLANQIFFIKDELSQPLANRLIRLAAFQNPEFYRAQAMRMPVWNIPRVIGCAENYAKHIALKTMVISLSMSATIYRPFPSNPS